MPPVDMTAADLATFLDEPRLAAVGGVCRDGGPGVLPAMFVRDRNALVLAPLAPRSARTRRLTTAEVEEFLQQYRYPVGAGSHPFVAAASLRKDGRPIVVPLGFLFQDGDFYLTVNNDRSLNKRLGRDPRLALGIFAHGHPERAVVARGRAEVVGDDGISRRIFARQMEVYPWLDFASYEKNWLAVGRTTYRLRPSSLSAWTAAGDADAPMAEPDEAVDVIPAVVAIYNEEFPTRVALFEGTFAPPGPLQPGMVAGFEARYGGAAGRRVAEAWSIGGVLAFAPDRIQSWDTSKQPEDRVTRGIDSEGRHVERGTWKAAPE